MPHPYYDFLLRAQGFGRAADIAAELVPQGRLREAAEHIDDEIVDRLTFTGDPASCALRLAAYDGLADSVIGMNIRAGSKGDRHAGYAEVFEMFALARAARADAGAAQPS